MKLHRRAKRLIQQFRDDMNTEGFWYDEQEMFIAWLTARRASLTTPTFTSYRKWLASYAEDLDFPDFASALRKIESKERNSPSSISVIRSGNTPKADGEASLSNQQISETITQQTLKTLASTLLSQRGNGDRYKNGILAFTWFQITVMTGVRPSEWATATLLQGVACNDQVFPWVLEITTAAKGNRHTQKHDLRETDRRRRLVLSDWTAEQIETLQLFLSQLPSDPITLKRTQESVRQTLLLACKTARLANPIGLYTGRHLFAAEVRRSDSHNRYQLAAMLGHSDTVNQKYYGNLTKGVSRTFSHPLPRPWPGAAEQIQITDRERYALIYGSEGAVDMLVTTGEL